MSCFRKREIIIAPVLSTKPFDPPDMIIPALLLVILILLLTLLAVVLRMNVGWQATIHAALREGNASQVTQLQLVAEQVYRANETIDRKLNEIRSANDSKLEEMRKTVDEKLQGTLERRLGESFKQVSERLEAVSKGLGEMTHLARGVDGLKRVLTNVKTRGTWGEVQLQALLEQILTREQYGQNVNLIPGSAARIEFALKLPGGQGDKPIWLPIDCKFPLEDYQRLVEASEAANGAAVEEAARALETRLIDQAKDIANKYIAPPHTTDFGVLYLPTEGLYAEALRRPGLAERMQRDYRVVLAGPTTVAALLNSLQVGFRTLAIQLRASEVWEILGQVKTEFGRFSGVLGNVKKKIDSASKELEEEVGVRTRAIERRLPQVEGLPAGQEREDAPGRDDESVATP